MSDRNLQSFDAYPRWAIIWFAVDALLALAPPLYWAADGKTFPVFGVPAAVFYFVAVGACICASIIATYWAEAGSGKLDP